MNHFAAREQAYSEVIARYEQVAERILRIDAELAERKRAWLQDGAPGSQLERAALEAERATLNVEKYTLEKTKNSMRKTFNALRKATEHEILIQMLIERGLGGLVSEAVTKSMDRILSQAANAEQKEST